MSGYTQPLEPELELSTIDPLTGIRGTLVIDRLVDGLAAGGLRIKPGTGPQELRPLARAMTLKQAALGLNVGGAKAGLDMDPADPRRTEVLRRFLKAISPLINDCYNCGPDVNTTMQELEALAAGIGLPSLKIAVGRRRGIADALFLQRYRLFSETTALGTVNQLRAPTAVMAAARQLVHHLGINQSQASVAIQGAGNMGGYAALLLHQCGMRVTAWADDQQCLVESQGLDVPELMRGRTAGRLPHRGSRTHSARLLSEPCDLLILAAVSDAIDPSMVSELRCRGIVVAANLGIAEPVEWSLAQRGIVVVPDLIASVGGSLAVEALVTQKPSTAEDILRHVESRIATSTEFWLMQRELHPEIPLRALILKQINAADADVSQEAF